MKSQHAKTRSIMKRITIPMSLVLILQIIIFWSTLISDGIFNELNKNAFDILNERVINRKTYIENAMIQQWSNFGECVDKINDNVSQTLKENNASVTQLTPESPLTSIVLNDISNNLIYILRKQGVTGSFIIFNGADSPYKTSNVSKSGLYIRDLDPLSNLENSSDLLFEHAPSSVTKTLKLAMDTNWTPNFSFTEETSYNYYFKPLQAAIEYPEISYSDLGYWSSPFQLFKNDIEIITYSIPLIDKDNVPYGVLGVEISTDYLKKLMPYSEINSQKEGAYVLGKVQENTKSFGNLLVNGPIFKQFYDEDNYIEFIPKKYGVNSHKVKTNSKTDATMYGSIQYFNLYNTNTPFEEEQWALIGLLESKTLFGFSNTVGTELILSTAVSLLIGLMVVYIVSRIVTNPIAALAQKVKTINPTLPIEFDKLHISEIDDLSSAIKQLSTNVMETSSKLSKILDMASFPIAAFEYTKETDIVFYTKNYFKLLGYKEDSMESGYMKGDNFNHKMIILKKYSNLEYHKDDAPIFKIQGTGENPYWIRLKLVEDNKYVFGVLEDITSEILEKKKIEHERDYDLLTNLLNRRAFYRKLERLFSDIAQLKTAAMIMFDLDNLKYINDTYGHDYGDKYIHTTANLLKSSSPEYSIVSRMSGDEFYLFLYGYENKAILLDDINKIWSTIKTSLFPLPDNDSFRIRASMGYAWYPEDSTSYEVLLHYADFAMYTVKNTTKGEIRQFNIEEYNEKSYLLQKREEFNKLIENELISYHFQPIVNAKTGTIFAYEALMRSKLDSLKSPYEIINIARSQSMLYHIEHLTWFLALKTFEEKAALESNYKIFINSISNQSLSQNDIFELEQLYKPLLHRIVIEITEDEQQNDNYAETKMKCAQSWGAGIALDDFGSGYNGDMMLLHLSPQYVKADISIIRGISTDRNRKTILKNLISYAKEQNIKVIAEGVETYEDMKTVVELGADLLQGFYLAKPNDKLLDIPHSIKEELLHINKEE